ncbi:acyl-CoA thioester hydrolase [Nocardia sp. GAS34]|uniref:thioesterase family protein n=1 Tax=unclassified Nocardia TaxID=2637762 RepID=UPI003D205AA2
MTRTTAVPSYHHIVRLPLERGPVVVPESFEDENGHMNVQHYFDLCGAGISVVFERIGINDDYRATRRQGFFIAEHHVRYYTETSVNDQVSVHSRILERSDKTVYGMTLMVNNTTERLACTLEMVAVNVDFTSRRATPFDADIAAAVDAELALAAAVHCLVPLCPGMGIRT